MHNWRQSKTPWSPKSAVVEDECKLRVRYRSWVNHGAFEMPLPRVSFLIQHTHESSQGFWWFGCFCFENFPSSGKFLFTIRTQGSINFYKTSWVSALWLSHLLLLWASSQHWVKAIPMWCFPVISYHSGVILVLMSGSWLHIWTDIEQDSNNHINVFLYMNSPSWLTLN